MNQHQIISSQSTHPDHPPSPEPPLSHRTAQQDTQAQLHQLVTLVQKHIRAYRNVPGLKTEIKKMRKRKSIIKQMLSTEEGYLRDLGFIVSDFQMRMKSRGILKDDECKRLFANVNEIRHLHDDFYSTLHNHFVDYHPNLVIFASLVTSIPYFKVYIEYLNNFAQACDLVEEFKKTKPSFASFVADINRNPQYRGLSLEDYMIMPVQRLPRYVLLLKQILKNTSRSHPDYHNVQQALRLFENVNTTNNDKLDKIRNSYKLRELEALLQLPEGIITPSTEFITEEPVHIISMENNTILTNCFMYLLSTYVIVTKRSGSMLARRTTTISTSHAARISQASGYSGGSGFKQKLQALVPLKYGTSAKCNRDQCFYKNSFTIQAPDGESCTFVCSNQEQEHNLMTKIKKQIDIIKEQTINRVKSMFQNENVFQNNTFIKNISMLDLVPEVTVLGTSERTDKMLKYTVYIVEVKVKMIRLKIFLRFSELLELEKFINEEYRGKITIRQGLVSSSWLNNHHQKTIEERKMNIQRFIKELLSKPYVIENGWKILLRLGLPEDFFELPNKICDKKIGDSFLRKSSAFGKSTVLGHFKKKDHKVKTATAYRLSVFQQVKIEEEAEEEEMEAEEQPVQQMIKKSFNGQQTPVNPKSSYGSSQQSQSLCIQDILKANEIDLGHYTRVSDSIDLGEDSPFANEKNYDTVVEMQVWVPCLKSLYSVGVDETHKGEDTFTGFQKIRVAISKLSRIQTLIPQIAKQIKVKYYKDFRLLVEKEYSQRVLDDDELVHKILSEIGRTKSAIFFRKVIYIDHLIEERELVADKERLMIQASQIINEIKMNKYRLNYESYLKFAVLSAIVYQESTDSPTQLSEPVLCLLAKQAKAAIFPKYSTLSQTESIWVEDFCKAYRIIRGKLEQILASNDLHLERQRQMSQQAQSQMFQDEGSFEVANCSFWVNTTIKYLAMLSIVKEIESKEILYGCISFSVQISQEFKKFLEEEAHAQLDFLINKRSESSITASMKGTQIQGSKKMSKDDLESIRESKKISEQENKNCWLAIKHNKIIFTSISKNNILLQLSYENIARIQTYSSAVILEVRNLRIKRLKLKTTSSYYIREMLVYYRNYRSVLKKIYTDAELRNSVIGATRDQNIEQMDEVYL